MNVNRKVNVDTCVDYCERRVCMCLILSDRTIEDATKQNNVTRGRPMIDPIPSALLTSPSPFIAPYVRGPLEDDAASRVVVTS